MAHTPKKPVYIFGDPQALESQESLEKIQKSDDFQFCGWMSTKRVRKESSEEFLVHAVDDSSLPQESLILITESDEHSAFLTLIDHGFLRRIAFDFSDLVHRFGSTLPPSNRVVRASLPNLAPKPVVINPAEWMPIVLKLLTEFNQPTNDTLEFKKNTVLITVCSNSHIGQAIACIKSWRRYHPTAIALVGLVDKKMPHDYLYPDEYDGHTHIIPVEEMGIPNLPTLVMSYSIYELCTALKPFFMHYALTKWKADRVIFADTDTLFFGPIREIEPALDGCSFLITPHIVTASRGRDLMAEKITANGGTINSGFLALNNCEKSIEFLEWWCERVSQYSCIDPELSLFGDQRWLDFLSGFDFAHFVFRHKAYNVAHWNLFERALTYREGCFWINETERLRHYHFTMIHRSDPNLLFITCTSPEVEMNLGIVALINFYRFLLAQNHPLKHGNAEPEWGFLRFSNGIMAPECLRTLFVRFEEKHNFPDPLNVNCPNSFYDLLNTPCVPGERLTNLFYLLNAKSENFKEQRASFSKVIDLIKSGHRNHLAWEFFEALARPTRLSKK
jgi:hypothetical protein